MSEKLLLSHFAKWSKVERANWNVYDEGRKSKDGQQGHHHHVG